MESALFADAAGGSTVFVNGRCRIDTSDGYRVVSVSGFVLAHYFEGDRMSEAYAMVNLVEQGWAKQIEVARAFQCSERTVRRFQQRFEDGGLTALGRQSGYPRGRPRIAAKRRELVSEWKAEGVSNREIARRLGISETAVRKQLRRLGWKPSTGEQLSMAALEDADQNLSTREPEPPIDVPESPQETIITADLPSLSAKPNLSGSAMSVSFDPDPSNRQVDRLLACLGLLEDAAPRFRTSSRVANAGVLLSIPAIVDSGVIDIAREIYGSIGPAFYGLRTTIVLLLLMALMRIKRPEGLKEHSPDDLGRLVGLDRVPEVKTLRCKLARLAACGRATDFGRALAERRVQSRGHAMGFLYVDGHVRAYHGKHEIPKVFVARRHLAMPATTDYWVNDATGEPLFVVTCEANKQLTVMLPVVLEEVRQLVGERRVTVVFDRGGWSPHLFKKLIDENFDILTYRKGKFRRVAKKLFHEHTATIDGRELRYMLADQGIRLLKGKLWLRQVTRLCDDQKHQTPIITSRRDLPAIEVAYRMFERWRQENFFKYLREEYALDALVDYSTEPADPTRTVPNPKRRELNAKIRAAYDEANHLAAEYGVEALNNPENVRRTMRGFKIASAPLSNEITDLLQRIMSMEKRKAKMPVRVPVQELVKGDVIKLSVERKHLSDLLKMVAYQAECELFRLIAPHYQRAEDEGRTLIHSALTATGDLTVCNGRLHLSLEPLSSPHRTKALMALCARLNKARTRFPGSKLLMQFSVKAEPPVSLAFPGERPSKAHSKQLPGL